MVDRRPDAAPLPASAPVHGPPPDCPPYPCHIPAARWAGSHSGECPPGSSTRWLPVASVPDGAAHGREAMQVSEEGHAEPAKIKAGEAAGDRACVSVCLCVCVFVCLCV